MILDKLYLQDFRQFSQRTFSFSPRVNLLIAHNGAGKTTILEALYLLSTGKSFRAKKAVELIKTDCELARTFALLKDKTRLGVTIYLPANQQSSLSKKTFSINKTNISSRRFVGNLLLSCFRPEDLRLIEGSASRRRDYLDVPLSLTSQLYRESLSKYGQILLRRNKTLLAIKLGNLPKDTLSYYDEQLLTLGKIISQHRQDYVDFANQQKEIFSQFTLNYQEKTLSEEKLAAIREREIACGFSLLGPQRDDLDLSFQFGTKKHTGSLITYGSRGQHRLAVLWLKTVELAYLKAQTEQQPLLLLDDICSELDQQSKQIVQQLSLQQQTIITTTEDNVVELWQDQAKLLDLVTNNASDTPQ